MMPVTKTSDQTQQRGHTKGTHSVCVAIPFILDVIVEVPAGVTHKEGHTGSTFLLRCVP